MKTAIIPPGPKRFEVGKKVKSPKWAGAKKWPTYPFFFPSGDWSESDVINDSAWGDGHNGVDYWGWPHGAQSRCTAVTKHANGLYYFEYSLKPDVGNSKYIVANFRVVRRGAHWVFGADWKF